MRFCIGHYRLNSITVKDTYYSPRMKVCIDTLGNAEYLTTLDAYYEYWQMMIL